MYLHTRSRLRSRMLKGIIFWLLITFSSLLYLLSTAISIKHLVSQPIYDDTTRIQVFCQFVHTARNNLSRAYH